MDWGFDFFRGFMNFFHIHYGCVFENVISKKKNIFSGRTVPNMSSNSYFLWVSILFVSFCYWDFDEFKSSYSHLSRVESAHEIQKAIEQLKRRRKQKYKEDAQKLIEETQKRARERMEVWNCHKYHEVKSLRIIGKIVKCLRNFG